MGISFNVVSVAARSLKRVDQNVQLFTHRSRAFEPAQCNGLLLRRNLTIRMDAITTLISASKFHGEQLRRVAPGWVHKSAALTDRSTYINVYRQHMLLLIQAPPHTPLLSTLIAPHVLIQFIQQRLNPLISRLNSIYAIMKITCAMLGQEIRELVRQAVH